MLISSSLNQEMNQWPDGRTFLILSEWTQRAACLRLWARLLLPLFCLVMEWGLGRLSHGVKLEDSHLEGNIQRLCVCEHSPASLFTLGWVLVSNTVTCPCTAEEVLRASIPAFDWSIAREKIHFQCHLRAGKVWMVVGVIIYLERCLRQADLLALAISWY